MDTDHKFHLFINFCNRQGLSPHTIRAYRSDLRDFQNWQSCHSFQSLDREILGAWLEEMRSRNYAPATIKRKLTTLQVALNWLETMNFIKKNPFHGFKISLKLPKKLPRALSRSNLSALFRQAEQEAHKQACLRTKTIRLALELLFVTGTRVGELCSIKLQNIDLESGAIKVNGKGSRERQVYIVNDNILLLLSKYIKERATYRLSTNILLLTSRGSAATPDFIRRNLHCLARHAGIKSRVTPHMLRHSAATQLLEQGVDIRYVQRLLGHSSISTTEIYTYVSNSSLKACLKQADPRALFNP
jgi:integrase/recombinase XerD